MSVAHVDHTLLPRQPAKRSTVAPALRQPDIDCPDEKPTTGGVPRHGHPPCHMFARSADGMAFVLRPLRPGETDVLENVFKGLSARSRYQRYLVPMSRLTSYASHKLADVDARNHVAWVALADGSPAGIGRYVRTADDTAEIALEVVDAVQGRGVGAALLDAVTTVAQVQGIDYLEAVVQPTNDASVALLTQVGITFAFEDGLLVGRGRLRLLGPPSRVNRRAVLALAAGAEELQLKIA